MLENFVSAASETVLFGFGVLVSFRKRISLTERCDVMITWCGAGDPGAGRRNLVLWFYMDSVTLCGSLCRSKSRTSYCVKRAKHFCSTYSFGFFSDLKKRMTPRELS